MSNRNPWKTAAFGVVILLFVIVLALIGWQLVMIVRDIIANGVWR